MALGKDTSKKALLSIGEAAKVANTSRKTLRFYHSIGILHPDEIGENEYRYYSKDTLFHIPVIKFYKQMGFHIDEIHELIAGTTCSAISRIFLDKLNERTNELDHIQRQYTSIKDWNAMITEALRVIEHNSVEVNMRFVDPVDCLSLKQEYKPDYRDAIINIEFTNFIESIDNMITGPVIRYFDSVLDYQEGSLKTQTIVQKPMNPNVPPEHLHLLGGNMMISCYHIGGYENIHETRNRMLAWAKEHGHKVNGGMYERYLVDYWLTNDEDQFVTELLMEISH